jgi:hypothetical protein
MFWREKLNKINIKGGLCPPLCRDPVRPKFFNNLSVEAAHSVFARPQGRAAMAATAPAWNPG